MTSIPSQIGIVERLRRRIRPGEGEFDVGAGIQPERELLAPTTIQRVRRGLQPARPTRAIPRLRTQLGRRGIGGEDIATRRQQAASKQRRATSADIGVAIQAAQQRKRQSALEQLRQEVGIRGAEIERRTIATETRAAERARQARARGKPPTLSERIALRKQLIEGGITPAAEIERETRIPTAAAETPGFPTTREQLPEAVLRQVGQAAAGAPFALPPSLQVTEAPAITRIRRQIGSVANDPIAVGLLERATNARTSSVQRTAIQQLREFASERLAEERTAQAALQKPAEQRAVQKQEFTVADRVTAVEDRARATRQRRVDRQIVPLQREATRFRAREKVLQGQIDTLESAGKVVPNKAARLSGLRKRLEDARTKANTAEQEIDRLNRTIEGAAPPVKRVPKVGDNVLGPNGEKLVITDIVDGKVVTGPRQ